MVAQTAEVILKGRGPTTECAAALRTSPNRRQVGGRSAASESEPAYSNSGVQLPGGDVSMKPSESKISASIPTPSTIRGPGRSK